MTQTVRQLDSDRHDLHHRTFRLTRPAHQQVKSVDPALAVSGWVRLTGDGPTTTSIRTSSISQVVGPLREDDLWIVRLTDLHGGVEVVGFARQEQAAAFVDDLLHDA